MKAIAIESHGPPSVAKVKDITEPPCLPGKVKVKIKSSSINHLDIWVRKGIPGLHIDLPRILGSDASGTVVEVGRGVDVFNVGDNVVIQPGIFDTECQMAKEGKENLSSSYGILGETHNGVQSEYVVLDPINLHPMPERLSFSEASSMALVFMTSYHMLIKRAELKPGENVLIYGASSGVGGAAIQIAKDLGCNVLTTVGEKSKVEYAESIGADAVFIHDSSLHSDIKSHIGNKCIDVVFEHIGEATWETSTKLLSKGGRLVTCGATTGANVRINLTHIFFKHLSILGSTMSTIDSFKEVFSKIEEGQYKPMIDSVFPFIEISNAHERIERRENLGKVVVEFD